MKNKEENREFLIKVLTLQINQSQQMTQYFHHIFKEMEYEIDSPKNDQMPLLSMVKTENKNDVFLTVENKSISMLLVLKAPGIQQVKKDFVRKMVVRVNFIIAYLEYIKKELYDLISITSPQGSKNQGVFDFKKLLQKSLDLTANSFSTVIEILDSNDIDTSKYKEILIYSSGEITPDLFNINVVSSLIQRWLTNIKNFFYLNTTDILTKIIVFILIMAAATIVSILIKKILKKTMLHSTIQLSQLMRAFIINFAGRTILLSGFMIALSRLGVNLGPVLAGLGIAGVVIAFALKETLSNITSGILILIYKPYDVGDIIKVFDVTGVVSKMSLVSTTINNDANERFIIPNTKIWEDKIGNLTAENERRVDMLFSIHHKADIVKAEEILSGILESHDKVMQYPEPQIKIHKLNSSSVDIVTMPWVKPFDYWDVYWDITRTVKLRFDEEGISIPYQQMDVHLHSDASQ